MEKGLDTMLYKELTEDGVELSGGEAQKIAIARALYKDAPFIILDEPTAALDPIAEAEIYSKFNEIAGDRTSIFISHRLSSCKFCDEIAVFHEGAVIQQGSHAELLADSITQNKYPSVIICQKVIHCHCRINFFFLFHFRLSIRQKAVFLIPWHFPNQTKKEQPSQLLFFYLIRVNDIISCMYLRR